MPALTDGPTKDSLAPVGRRRAIFKSCGIPRCACKNLGSGIFMTFVSWTSAPANVGAWLARDAHLGARMRPGSLMPRTTDNQSRYTDADTPRLMQGFPEGHSLAFYGAAHRIVKRGT